MPEGRHGIDESGRERLEVIFGQYSKKYLEGLGEKEEMLRERERASRVVERRLLAVGTTGVF